MVLIFGIAAACWGVYKTYTSMKSADPERVANATARMRTSSSLLMKAAGFVVAVLDLLSGIRSSMRDEGVGYSRIGMRVAEEA